MRKVRNFIANNEFSSSLASPKTLSPALDRSAVEIVFRFSSYFSTFAKKLFLSLRRLLCEAQPTTKGTNNLKSIRP